MGQSILVALLLVLLIGCGAPATASVAEPEEELPELIVLPAARRTGSVSLEEALSQRRSVREYLEEPLSLEEVGQLLWAAQGVTADWGGRTAPSAGGLYPLAVYVAAGAVVGLDPGVYRYVPGGHKLEAVLSADVRRELAEAAMGQSSVRDAAAILVISAVYERTTGKYGDRGVKYAHMEAGHVAQNVYLQAAALHLGTVAVGAFDDRRVTNLLGLDSEEDPLYLMPIGRPA